MARRPLSTVARAASAKGCIATGSDDLLTWRKNPNNPVIPEPPAGPDLIECRDYKCVARAGRLVPVDGGRHPRYGWNSSAVPLDRLRKWEHLHPQCMDDRHAAEDMWTGSMWECPDFSALDDRHVLITWIWDKRHFCCKQRRSSAPTAATCRCRASW